MSDLSFTFPNLSRGDEVTVRHAGGSSMTATLHSVGAEFATLNFGLAGGRTVDLETGQFVRRDGKPDDAMGLWSIDSGQLERIKPREDD